MIGSVASCMHVKDDTGRFMCCRALECVCCVAFIHPLLHH